MTLGEFERTIFQVADASALCGIPVVGSLTPTSENIRVPLTSGGFADAFFNEKTGTTAFAMLQDGKRIFGADNTGGWHLHPFENPESHDPIPQAMTFGEFIQLVEAHYSVLR